METKTQHSQKLKIKKERKKERIIKKKKKKYIPTPVIITLLKTKSKDNILKTEKNHVSHIGEQQLEQL